MHLAEGALSQYLADPVKVYGRVWWSPSRTKAELNQLDELPDLASTRSQVARAVGLLSDETLADLWSAEGLARRVVCSFAGKPIGVLSWHWILLDGTNLLLMVALDGVLSETVAVDSFLKCQVRDVDPAIVLFIQIVDHLQPVERLVNDEGPPLSVGRSHLVIPAAELGLVDDRDLVMRGSRLLSRSEDLVILLVLLSTIYYLLRVLGRQWSRTLTPPRRTPYPRLLALRRLLWLQRLLLVVLALESLVAVARLGHWIRLVEVKLKMGTFLDRVVKVDVGFRV